MASAVILAGCFPRLVAGLLRGRNSGLIGPFGPQRLVNLEIPAYYAAPADAGWSSLAARRAHNPKVAGSNPAPATKNEKSRSQRDRLFHFRYREVRI